MQDIKVITFDCYGTLVDWEKGATDVLKSILSRSASKVPAKRVFDRWEEIQFEYIQEPYEAYRDILYHSLLDTLDELEIPYRDTDGDRFANAIGQWKPFDETPGALARLKGKFRLGIISNIDDDILQQTLPSLGVPFDYLVTAERAGFYKPDPEPFRVALEEINLPAREILHSAFGFKYDLGPASKLGFKTAFVNRGSVALPPEFRPAITVRSLTELAESLGT